MTPLGISFWSNESNVKINFLFYNKDRVTTSPANSPSVTFSSGATALRARGLYLHIWIRQSRLQLHWFSKQPARMSNTTANSSGNHVCTSVSCIFTKEERDVIVVSLFSIAVISLAGNIPILIVILFSAKRRNSSNLSTVNLVVSDLLMTVFCIPFVTLDMYVYDAWVFGSAMCRLVTFVQNSAIVASLMNLLTITCEKFLAIRFPFHLRLRKKLVCRSMPVAWIIAIAHSIFYVHFRKRMEFGGTYYCIDDWPDSQTLKKALLILKSTMFFVPLFLIVVLHSITMHTLFRGRNTFHLQQQNGDRNLFRTTARKQRRQRKAVKIILATLVSIIMCWGPFHILALFLLLRQDEGFGRNVYIAYTVSVWLLFSHCSVLPFIFFFLTKKGKETMDTFSLCLRTCSMPGGSNSGSLLLDTSNNHGSRGSSFRGSVRYSSWRKGFAVVNESRL